MTMNSTATAQVLIDETHALVQALIQPSVSDEDLAQLRAEGRVLLVRMSKQMRDFADENGLHIPNPVNRAWYLLSEMFEHRTLLG